MSRRDTEYDDAQDHPGRPRRIVGRGWELFEIRSMDPTLEDVFIEIIAGEKEVAA